MGNYLDAEVCAYDWSFCFMALNMMEKVICVLLYPQHLSPALGAERNHPGMQFSKMDFLIS
jgi:hypothetical protein